MKRVTESLAAVSQRSRSRKRRRAKLEASCIISNPLCHPFHGFRYCFYAIEGLRAPCWRTLRSTPSLLICRPLHGLLKQAGKTRGNFQPSSRLAGARLLPSPALPTPRQDAVTSRRAYSLFTFSLFTIQPSSRLAGARLLRRARLFPFLSSFRLG